MWTCRASEILHRLNFNDELRRHSDIAANTHAAVATFLMLARNIEALSVGHRSSG